MEPSGCEPAPLIAARKFNERGVIRAAQDSSFRSTLSDLQPMDSATDNAIVNIVWGVAD